MQLKYKLPTHFDASIHNKLEKGHPLLFNDYSAFARDVARQILPITHHPDSEFVKFVVNKAMKEYPNVCVNKKDGPETEVCMNPEHKLLDAN